MSPNLTATAAPDAEPPAGRYWTRRQVLLAAIFATVLAQIVAMALISKYNVHPDERSHVTTADYYLRWWLPPPAGDVRVLPSISAYGFSYHYNPTPTYFLAGRTVAPIRDLIRHPFRAFRLWNAALFAVVVGVALRLRDRRFALLLLLCPAQVWYLFSYFNDDAMALALSLLCCWQVTVPGAATARFLAADDWRTGRWGALGLALMLALLLLSKQNYRVFLGFLGLYAVWTLAFSGDFRRARRLGLKWCALALAALCLAWPRLALDAWINRPDAPGNRGLSKWQRVREVADSTAISGFRPSQSGTEDAYPGLDMRSSGTSFLDLFNQRYRWHEITFQSLVGVYGYVSIYGDAPFYLAMLAAYLSLLATVSFLTWRHGTRPQQLLWLLCLLTWAALVLASARHSWMVDFEPQGRYLFPGIGVLFLAFSQLRTCLPEKLLWRYGVLIWLLSCYSFLFTGLRSIPKFAG